jgi:hypothetical protein
VVPRDRLPSQARRHLQITHEHKSTPFYMDGSFKAAVDLQP